MERLLLSGVAFLGESFEDPIEFTILLKACAMCMRSAPTMALFRKTLFLGTALCKDS